MAQGDGPDAAVDAPAGAAAAERARRRHAELEGRGEDISYEEVLAQLRERDERDSGRPDAPMKRASDAHLLDTSKMSIDAAFEEARRIVDQVMAQRRQWFEKPAGAFMALWWLPAGRLPTAEEGLARVDLLDRAGAGAEAFTFKSPFDSAGRPVERSTLVRAIEPCA